MATFTVKGRPTWLGELDMSRTANTVAVDYGADAMQSTTLSDETHANIGGLKSFGFSMDTFSDFDTVDSVLNSKVGEAVPLTFSTQSGAAGEVGYMIVARQLTHVPIAGSVGDIAGANVSGNAVGDLARGVIEFNGATASSASSTGSQLGALSAAQELIANLHVTAAAGTTLDVLIESDDNAGFTTAVTRGTFTQVTGLTSENLTIAGAITDDYWRITYTIAGGSFTFAVGLGIN